MKTLNVKQVKAVRGGAININVVGGGDVNINVSTTNKGHKCCCKKS